MFKHIFAFEIRYHLKQPTIWVCLAIFFLLTFGAVGSDSIQIGGSIGNVNRNAPVVIMQLMLILSVFGMFTTTAFVANSVNRDFELGTDSIFFSAPIKKRDYLLGRFAGSFVVSMLIFAGVALAIMLASMMPWIDKERIGAFMLQPYLFSLFGLVLPNVFICAALFFSVAALTRSMMASYAAAVALFVGYIASRAALGNLDNEVVASLSDPFSLSPFALATRYWTVFERNTRLLPITGIFLYNRLLWVGLAVAVLLFAVIRFRFAAPARKSSKRSKKADVEPAENLMTAATPVPSVRQRFGGTASLAQFWEWAKLEFFAVLRSPAFLIILALAVVNVVVNALLREQLYGTSVRPVTHQMIQAIREGFLFFALIILLYYAGEIVWRERGLKMSDVSDTTPVPTWVFWASKLLALVMVAYALMTISALATIVVQTIRGYHNYELLLYLKGLFVQEGIGLILFCVMTFFLQVLANNKYVGIFLTVAVGVLFAVMPSMHLEHNLYLYGTVPDAPYSDMNGYGHFVQPLVWFNIYWSCFAVVLIALAHLYWVRGSETSMRVRSALAKLRLNGKVVSVMTLALAAFVASGAYIFYNTNVLNRYRTQDEGEKQQAEYEKKYKTYERLEQPRITAVQADVDIYPERRTVDIRGSYTLVNKWQKPVTELHVTMPPDRITKTITIPGATVSMEDKENGYTIYKLSSPIPPGASLPLQFTVHVERKGFVNNGANNNIVYNGTFFNNFDYFPHLGYFPAAELQDRGKRRKYGLKPVERLPKQNDMRARMNNEISTDTDWMSLDTTVSTSADQTALAPGYLQKEWTQNGRRYFHYKTEAPILGFFAYLSARYEVKRDKWNGVNIEIYYDRHHPYNVDRMIDSTKRSLDYYTKNFSPYQHHQVRILEFPRYARFAQSFPNTIPFSESIGFIANVSDPADIDYVYYVTAHEVGHQWWAHQAISGAVQGATMITETMAQYSALMVMEHQYGRDQMQRFLRYELNRYLAGRGGELVAEMPLELVEGQQYIHYAKGSLVMYALRDYAGEDNVNKGAAKFLKDVSYQQPPYTTSTELVNDFRQFAPASALPMIHDLFETITLYDNKTTETSFTKLPNGKFHVKMTVESTKLRSTGGGDEKPIPLDDWIDIGVLGEKKVKGGKKIDEVLFLEKRHITQGKNTFEVVVDKLPARAGIDPLNKLIDRNPGDNTKKVTSGK
jgi:ABC-2 type transport system permease protein